MIEASYGWDASPITLQRLSAEVWDVVADKDWASVGGGVNRLWNVDKFYRTMGAVNGGGSADHVDCDRRRACAPEAGRLVRFSPTATCST